MLFSHWFMRTRQIFMPDKGKDINLRRLYTVLGAQGSLTEFDAVASLDAEKAFNSVE